ncbi:MAG: ATPase, T2SS/T4P/T4SS family, partial [Bdellovibrionota bacterium]
ITPPWLSALMTDPQVTDICVNGGRSCFFDRGNGMEAFTFEWATDDFRLWVLHQISTAGKSWDAKNPFLDAVLASGHRLHVTFPPLSRLGILLSLRRLPSTEPTAQNNNRWSSSPLYPLVRDAVIRGDTVLISGATGSGKTTLANDLLERVPSHERILALEDTSELRPHHPHFINLESRPPNADGLGEVSIRTLLKQSLRMRPDRIILGECRGGEVLDLLQLLNTGHRGALATLHAHSPRDALRRVELLCLLHGQGTIPGTVIRDLLVSGVQWIVQVGRRGSERKIIELQKVEGREGDTILLRPMIQIVG